MDDSQDIALGKQSRQCFASEGENLAKRIPQLKNLHWENNWLVVASVSKSMSQPVRCMSQKSAPYILVTIPYES